jgi:response regulator RpfG family c-di-GMP phosphodiesterase
MVELHTGTNLPAVSVNSLLAAAMMKHTERWNGTGAPTQSIPQAASLTLSACDN